MLELILWLCVFWPFLFHYFYKEFVEQKKISELEQELPSALLQIASYPPQTPFEKIIEDLSDGNRQVNKEFSKILSSINAGESVGAALDASKRATKSRLFERSLELLSSAYETGADLSNSFKEIAEYALELSSIEKDRKSTLAIQKYTLLAAVFLVPALIAIVFALVAKLDSSSLLLSQFGFGENTELKQSVFLASQGYLVIFCLLVSYFMCVIDGDKKRLGLYAITFLPICAIVFLFFSTKI